MKDSIFTLKILLTLTSLSLSQVQASNVDMNSKKDCAIRSKILEPLNDMQRHFCSRAMDLYKKNQQTKENVLMACSNKGNVSWDPDLNNKMITVNKNHPVAKAMFIISAKHNETAHAFQICKGVFIAPTHAVLKPGKNMKKDWLSLSPYPRKKGKKLSNKDLNFEFYSPRLRDNTRWDDPTADYVFIKIPEKNLKKAERIAKKKKFRYSRNNFVTPVSASSRRLVEASNNGEIDVYHYRGDTRYQHKKDGTPLNFNKKTWAKTGKQLSETYKKVKRLERKIELRFRGDGQAVGTNTASEDSVSGTPYTPKIGGKNYLGGVHVSGVDEFRKNGKDKTFVPSKTYCDDPDYEKLCGKPCPDLDDLLRAEAKLEVDLIESVSKACGISNKQCGAKSYELSIKYRDGSFKSDYKKSATYLIQAADKKYPSAYLDLAMLHESGKQGANKNAGALASEYLKAFAKKSKFFWDYKGLFELSDSFKPDAGKAASYYFKALEAGDASLLNRKAKSWNLKTGKALQLLLKDDGYYTGAIDGILGKGTKAAFRKLCKCK